MLLLMHSAELHKHPNEHLLQYTTNSRLQSPSHNASSKRTAMTRILSNVKKRMNLAIPSQIRPLNEISTSPKCFFQYFLNYDQHDV